MEPDWCPRCYYSTNEHDLYCSEVCEGFDATHEYPNPPPPTLVQRGYPDAVEANRRWQRPKPKPYAVQPEWSIIDVSTLELPNLARMDQERDAAEKERLRAQREEYARAVEAGEIEPEPTESPFTFDEDDWNHFRRNHF
ncbi:hypothetical protein IWQ60_002107 [Tieghemiomyces parasiticus]|uniref:Uncharacterized protein n=1 Tax=Tieghemiomyces parasiticus TaxID=78921 RepID=A0A9W8ADB9_9FUNG|nr:hypothetical protein IWQ60_002749 [Tieghemiomyces parasiticus]KAJ1928385.1 hypothetical protein IWQ60_002107 [Tieghemiomyces parasiticus]